MLTHALLDVVAEALDRFPDSPDAVREAEFLRRTCATCSARIALVVGDVHHGVRYCSDECRAARRKPVAGTPEFESRYAGKRAPCAGGCGKNVWAGVKGTLPPGQAMCQACRRARWKVTPSGNVVRTPKSRRAWLLCDYCGGWYQGRRGRRRFCSRTCAAKGTSRPGERSRGCRGRYDRRQWKAPGLTEKQRKALLQLWKRRGMGCAYCGALATTVDHVIPLVLGGTNFEGNLAPACRPCNSSKCDLLLIEWRARKAARHAA